MKNQDILSILITFTVGFFGGAYLYVVGFAPTFKLPDADTSAVYNDMIIVGESFGECEELNSCLSFQLLKDGSYRVLFENTDGGEQIAKEGTVPNSIKKELDRILLIGTLQKEAREMEDPFCRFGEDKTNFFFHITLDDIKYTLNTCSNDIDYEGPAWATLTKLWNYLADLKTVK